MHIRADAGVPVIVADGMLLTADKSKFSIALLFCLLSRMHAYITVHTSRLQWLITWPGLAKYTRS